MNTTSLTALPLVLLLGVAAPCVAQKADGASAHSKERPKQDMKSINRTIRGIGSFLKKPEGAAPMDQVAALQQLVMGAKFKTPPMLAKQSKDEKAAALREYRKMMNAFLRQALELEEAMDAGEWEKAGKALAAIGDLKKTGHDKFKGRSRGE